MTLRPAHRRIAWTTVAAGAAFCGPGTLVLAAPPGANNRLVFADEFNGTSLDTTKWSAGSPSWSMPNSVSTMSTADTTVANGNMVLSANRTSASAFDSGAASTYNKYGFTGGYVEARVDLPSTPGSWPAFWGLYTGWPPEADIMEYPLTTNGGTSGYAANQYSTNYHYTNTAGAAAAGAGVVNAGQDLGATGYHTFGMDWVADTSVTFYLDGKKVQSYTGSSVAQMKSMYMILDYAVGGWPGTPSTSQWAVGAGDTFKVDYVRVYQANPDADAASNWTVNGSGNFATAANWTLGTPGYAAQAAVFGRVGTAAAATVAMPAWTVTGGLQFAGGSDGTTAYTIGAGNTAVQLAGATETSTVSVLAAASSTAVQTINSNLEFWSNVRVENQMTANALVLGGVLSGAGSLTVAGPGAVQFSNNNTYTGDTYIGTTATPAGTALVTRSRPFGSTGTVYLGAQANNNAAVIQIQDGRSVPNTIQFAGRGSSTTDNVTPGLQNLGGSNAFTGTVNLVRGGANYVVQSDAGLLTLSGSTDATTPNVALQIGSAVGGFRTVRLQGAGDGAITGTVGNGSGTLALAKSGAGTWTLSANNVFSGGLTVSAGTLVADANAALGSGAVAVTGAGTTLAVTANHVAGGLSGLTMSGGTVLSLAGPASGLALASGTFALGDVTIDLNHLYDALGQYTLIDAAAPGSTLGLVTLTDANTAAYRFSVAMSGNDAVLTVSAVPEPAALGALGATAALVLRRRRRA